jgi:methylenetetrahydrofolate dehydrogenase (NADP+)/methenyltetrahydrofolate cyclohydrolase
MMPRRLARQLCYEVRETVENCGMLHPPHVILILVGEDLTAACYSEDFEHAARATGVRGAVRKMAGTISASELRSTILSLNSDRAVHGIILQLPLPAHCGDYTELLQLISPEKVRKPPRPQSMANACFCARALPLIMPPSAFLLAHRIWMV